MIIPIKQGDIDALVEMYLCDGHSFGTITRAIRDEWPHISVRESIVLGAWSIKSIAQTRDALGATARRTWEGWRAAHPNIKL